MKGDKRSYKGTTMNNMYDILSSALRAAAKAHRKTNRALARHLYRMAEEQTNADCAALVEAAERLTRIHETTEETLNDE